MFNLIINFCVFVFIFYAVGNSARVILFGSKRKKRAYSHGRAVRRRKAKVIKLNARTTKRPLRKKRETLNGKNNNRIGRRRCRLVCTSDYFRYLLFLQNTVTPQ